MPRVYDLKTNFVAGELDPLLLGRSDIKHYFNGAERLRNAIVLPQGGAARRPGGRYIATLPNLAGGGISNSRLCEFQFNTDQTYLIIFTHELLQIYKDEAKVFEIATPFQSDDLIAQETSQGDLISSGLYWTQSKDTLIIFHENYPTKRLQRTGSDTSWSLTDLAYENIPDFDFGITYTGSQAGVDEVQELEFPNPGSQGNWTDGDTFALIVEDEETDNIQFTTVASTLRTRIELALRALPNTAAAGVNVTNSTALTSTSVFEVTFQGDDGKRPWGQIFSKTISAEQVPSIDIIITTKGKNPGEPVWSVGRGYPRCGVFFQGRLWVASSKDLPHWVWASRPGSEVDFNSKLFSEDYGIAVPADTDDVPAFTACHVGRHLQFFSRSGEYYIPVSDRESVTPGNIALRRTTSRGNKAGLRVFDVDGATHFIQRRGRALREFLFTDIEQAYEANNISLLSPHLMRDPIDFALRRSTSTTDADYEFLPNSDGTQTVFCTLRKQEVNAMTLWATKGKYKSVVSVLDKVWFTVERTIDGANVLMLEKQDEDLTVDCAIVENSAGLNDTVAHLPNTEVDVLLDDIIQAPVTTDGSGVATFARAAVNKSVVGLRFEEPDSEYPGFTWLIKTLPIEIALPNGSMVGRRRRIVNLAVRLRETTALQVNDNIISFQEFGSSLLDQAVTPFTGVKTIRGLLGWSFDGSVVLGGKQSLPATVLALNFGVSV